MLWVLTCTVHLLYDHVMSRTCLRVNLHSIVSWMWRGYSQMPEWNDKNIESNAPYRCELQTQLNHLSSLVKWLTFRLWTKWLWIRVQLQSLKLQISRLLRKKSCLTFKELILEMYLCKSSCSSLRLLLVSNYWCLIRKRLSSVSILA